MDVGLSIWMGLQATALFLIFVFLYNLDFTLLSLPVLYGSLVSLLVSLASHPSINTPMLLCKKQDGTFPIWSLIVFSPYLYFVRIFSFLRRFTSGEEPYNEICEGVYVGGLPYSVDKLPPGNPAIIDCTCEFPRKEEFKGHSYLCLPTWDTRAPQPGEIESAVKWAIRKRAQNVPVYIHCAYGHGRSVAVMCALLVALGVVEDWKKAEQLISERRPYISMNSDHYKALEEWSKHRLSTPTINEVNSSSAVPSTSSGRSRADRPKNRCG
ncbi:Dual specificity phosphatase protein [Salix suchowensis]|nr:Dual specificity phosphatase protein [Salix suchowensis]